MPADQINPTTQFSVCPNNYMPQQPPFATVVTTLLLIYLRQRAKKECSDGIRSYGSSVVIGTDSCHPAD